MEGSIMLGIYECSINEVRMTNDEVAQILYQQELNQLTQEVIMEVQRLHDEELFMTMRYIFLDTLRSDLINNGYYIPSNFETGMDAIDTVRKQKDEKLKEFGKERILKFYEADSFIHCNADMKDTSEMMVRMRNWLKSEGIC